MHQVEPVGVAVLEVLELLEEHDRPGGPVAVDQRDGALRLDLQRGRHDRQHRRDAAAGRDGAVVLGVGRVERGEEAAGRRHHVEHVADLQRAGGVPGERAAGQPLDADPQPAARLPGRRSSSCAGRRRRRPSVRTVRCWPCAEGVVVAQLVGDVEGDRHRVVGEPLDRCHRAAGGRRRGGGRCRRGRSSSSVVDRHQMRLEVVERLAAGVARPQRLAGGRAEPAELAGVRAAALRAAHRQLPNATGPSPRGRRRRDAVLQQLAPARVAHPVGGPGRGQDRCAPRRCEPGRAQRVARRRRIASIAGQPE